MCQTIFVFAQSAEFGQNRVQYHDFTWQFYTSENFSVYFYLGGQELGKFAAQIAENHLEEIQTKLEFRINHKIEILVYNHLSDLKQTNIGIGLDEQNTGGVTHIIGFKAFVYFNGSHRDLERQIKEGIAKIFINDMLYGGSIQDVLQNAVLLNLPDWFIDGLVAYIGEEWNSDLDNRLRDGILSKKFKKFSRIAAVDSRFAGQSVWYYVSEKFGPSAIPNLLYLTRINRSLESGFLFVLGMPVNRALKDWFYFFSNKYSAEENLKMLPVEDNIVKKKNKNKNIYRELRINPNGEQIAYVSNQLGKYRVHILNTETNQSKVILRGGFKSVTQQIDNIYPMLAWDPMGQKLAAIYEKRNKIKLLVYDFEAKKKKKTKNAITKFQSVLNMSFMNPQTLLLSGVNKGQSDIYTYHIPSTRTEQITNDYFDDLQPSYIRLPSKQGILFTSNRNDDTLRTERLDTILPTDHLDVFFYDYTKRGQTLTRVTNTEGISESFPVQYNNSHLSYLSDKNGIRNRYVAYFDSVFARYDTLVFYKDSTVKNPVNLNERILKEKDKIDSTRIYSVFRNTAISSVVTNYSRNILEQDIALKSWKTVELILNNGQYIFYKNPIPSHTSSASLILNNTSFRSKTMVMETTADFIPYQQPPVVIKSETNPLVEQQKTNINNYYFQTEFSEPISLQKTDSTTTQLTETATTLVSPQKEKPTIQLSKIRLYRLKFGIDYIVTQLDNSIIFNQYQNFTGSGSGFTNPDLNAMIKVGISDLFEDYKLVTGFRMPTNFSGGEYFVRFDNLRKRIDKRIILYRKTDLFSREIGAGIDPLKVKIKTNFAQATFSYPLDILRSIRLHLGYRNDKIIFLSESKPSLELPNYNEHWGLAKTEFVHDNTIKTGLNLYNGTRYKIFAEYHQKLNAYGENFTNGRFKIDGNVMVTGLDFRHYQKIHKQIIWATRLNASTSFGLGNKSKHRKIVYYLGGVDNWLFPRFDSNVPISQNAGYAYQSLATNMRGFQQNVRNGNSYVLMNTEVRIPLFAYLFSKPIRSDFIRNFQVVGFFDAGTAWEGSSPFNKDNPFNTEIISNGPVVMVVNYYRNPIVLGYGIGARSLVFGYFVRGDLGWSNDNGIKRKPIFYFSLSTDF